MKYLSVCSGIEAASVAWHHMGWEPLAFSEIEAFPRAVLAHHYPNVPIHGDFTHLRDHMWIEDADVLVGGTPCQAFSVAGLRRSLDDDRGNLSLEFVRLADAIDDLRSTRGRAPAVVLWENVPGVLSVKDNAFGCFLAALAGDVTAYVPPRGKWTDAGVVIGPQRAVAWRILDAQYFGLAQRRRRVFVVSSAREGFDPAAVLLECEGVRRDTPPRREAGQIAPTIPARSLGGGGLGTDFDLDGGVIRQWPADIAATLNAAFGDKQGLEDQHALAGASLFVPHPAAIVGTLTARGNTSLGAPEVDGGQFVPMVASAITAAMGGSPTGHNREDNFIVDVAHSPRGEGFDASEDGTGRGTPLVPVAFSSKDHGADATEDLSPTLRAMPHNESHANGGGQMAVAYSIMPQNSGKDYKAREVEVAQPIMAGGPVSGNQGGDVILQPVAYPLDLRNAGRDPEKHDAQNRQGVGVGDEGDPMHTLSTAFVPGVAYAFQPRIGHNGHGDMDDLVHALTAQSGLNGKGDAAPCVAVGFYANEGSLGTGNNIEMSPTLKAHPKTSNLAAVAQHMAVRRLTPVECERLQGFPDNYTAIPWRGKPASECPDGPRYKALGNSMAVPCMRWIGERINAEANK